MVLAPLVVLVISLVWASPFRNPEVIHPHKVLEKHPHLKLKETPIGFPILSIPLDRPTYCIDGYQYDDLPMTEAGILPAQFDWRNVSGVSYVTRTLNQHIPKYCGSCWAHASTSSFNDRLKIMRNAEWPDIELSVQYILNCLNAAGTCNGGSDLLVYEQIQSHPVPDETCEVYVAEDQSCTPENQCRNCFGPPANGFCFPQPRYMVYRAQDFGYFESAELKLEHRIKEAGLKGDDIVDATETVALVNTGNSSIVDHMKREIFQRGPISCAVDADVMFDYNKGDIVTSPGREPNHVISVAGWDETGEIPYWIIRNSWGTYWGDRGWANVKMGENVALIESFCSWVLPDWPPHEIIVQNATTPSPTKVFPTVAIQSSTPEHDPRRRSEYDDAPANEEFYVAL